MVATVDLLGGSEEDWCRAAERKISMSSEEMGSTGSVPVVVVGGDTDRRECVSAWSFSHLATQTGRCGTQIGRQRWVDQKCFFRLL